MLQLLLLFIALAASHTIYPKAALTQIDEQEIYQTYNIPIDAVNIDIRFITMQRLSLPLQFFRPFFHSNWTHHFPAPDLSHELFEDVSRTLSNRHGYVNAIQNLIEDAENMVFAKERAVNTMLCRFFTYLTGSIAYEIAAQKKFYKEMKRIQNIMNNYQKLGELALLTSIDVMTNVIIKIVPEYKDELPLADTHEIDLKDSSNLEATVWEICSLTSWLLRRLARTQLVLNELEKKLQPGDRILLSTFAQSLPLEDPHTKLCISYIAKTRSLKPLIRIAEDLTRSRHIYDNRRVRETLCLIAHTLSWYDPSLRKRVQAVNANRYTMPLESICKIIDDTAFIVAQKIGYQEAHPLIMRSPLAL